MKNVKKLLEQMGDLTILDKNQMNLLIAGDDGSSDPPPDNTGTGTSGGGGTGSGGETDPPITSGG